MRVGFESLNWWIKTTSTFETVWFVIFGRARSACVGFRGMMLVLMTGISLVSPNAALAFRASSPYASPSHLTQAQAPINGVKHFGYPLLASVSGLGTPDFSVVPEIKKHTNIVGVWYDPSNPTGLLPLIDQLSADFKGVIFVQKIFLKPNGESYTPSEIATRLNTFKNVILSRRTNILYLGFDEALLARQTYYCNGVSSCTFGPIHKQVTSEAVPELEQWMFDVRNAVPGPGVFVVESGNMIQQSLDLPVNADVYAFNCYRPMNDCYGETMQARWDRLKEKVSELNRNLSGHRRLAVVPESMLIIQRQPAVAPSNPLLPPMTVSSASDDAGVVALLESYKPFWKDDPMVTLVSPFLWSLVDAGDQATMIIGARSLPRTRAWLENLGYAVTGKRILPWRGPPVVQFMRHPVVKVGEYSIWAWSATGAMNCRSVTEPSSFQNLGVSGQVFHFEDTPREGSYTIACDGPGGTTTKSIFNQTVR